MTPEQIVQLNATLAGIIDKLDRLLGMAAPNSPAYRSRSGSSNSKRSLRSEAEFLESTHSKTFTVTDGREKTCGLTGRKMNVGEVYCIMEHPNWERQWQGTTYLTSYIPLADLIRIGHPDAERIKAEQAAYSGGRSNDRSDGYQRPAPAAPAQTVSDENVPF